MRPFSGLLVLVSLVAAGCAGGARPTEERPVDFETLNRALAGEPLRITLRGRDEPVRPARELHVRADSTFYTLDRLVFDQRVAIATHEIERIQVISRARGRGALIGAGVGVGVGAALVLSAPDECHTDACVSEALSVAAARLGAVAALVTGMLAGAAIAEPAPEPTFRFVQHADGTVYAVRLLR